MAIGWNFPSNNYGTLNGIGEAGIETFKGSPYPSLAREICQNSLDAKGHDDQPVVVEFSCFEKDICDLPDFDHLKEAFDACLAFWTEHGNKKTIDFFKKAVRIVNQTRIPVLRISDFHTTGLTGSDQNYNTPWQNLVKASGVSDKSGSSGGSFGIGKSAPFACSDCRTVFYTTQDKNGLKASQGIARLVSFCKKGESFGQDQDQITTGIGYYGNQKHNSAINACLSLDPHFERRETGTDVYVLAFSDKNGWQKDVIAAVLDDFLISVYSGLLEVRVGDVEITRHTLAQVIETYKEAVPTANNYYQALTSKDAHRIKHEFEHLGEIELHLLIQNGLHRKVFMSRQNGMKVFDQKNISSAIQFAGICILKDEKINAYFREMENPQHDAWEPQRHTKPSEAKKRKQALFRFIKEQVLEIGRKTTVAETDAEGMGDFLPDEFTPAPGTEDHETISDRTKGMDLNMSGLKSVQKGFEPLAGLNDDGMEDADGIPDHEVIEDRSEKDFDGIHHKASKGDNRSAKNFWDDLQRNGRDSDRRQTGIELKDGEGLKRKFEIKLMSIRLMMIDRVKRKYRLIFRPEESAAHVFLSVRLSAEQGNQYVKIVKAVDALCEKTLNVEKNRIFLEDLKANQKTCVDFKVDFIEQSSMEVALHGYQE